MVTSLSDLNNENYRLLTSVVISFVFQSRQLHPPTEVIKITVSTNARIDQVILITSSTVKHLGLIYKFTFEYFMKKLSRIMSYRGRKSFERKIKKESKLVGKNNFPR